jgi:hypothetical protein
LVTGLVTKKFQLFFKNKFEFNGIYRLESHF